MELRKDIGNDRSDVLNLQQLLNQKGFACIVDGVFGDNTEKCVCAAQKSFGLIPNGIANDIFLSVLKKSLTQGSPVQVVNIQPKISIPVVVSIGTKGPLTFDTVKQSMPYASDFNINRFLDPLNLTVVQYQINTPQRLACFLAQVAHESSCLQYTKELADGSTYDKQPLARDLGNTQPGDGPRYKGRGLIQVTGKYNYEQLSKDLGGDFLNHPELLEQPKLATLTAGWFWNKRNLNQYCDSGDFRSLTQKINGGLNGWESRVNYYIASQKALGIVPQVKPVK
jgi:putative chitinase